MFSNPYGPISIIYSFIPISDIYEYRLNLISRNIYKMISDHMHLRQSIDILINFKPNISSISDVNKKCPKSVFKLNISFILDVCRNKKCPKSVFNLIFTNLLYYSDLDVFNVTYVECFSIFILDKRSVSPKFTNSIFHVHGLICNHRQVDTINIIRKTILSSTCGLDIIEYFNWFIAMNIRLMYNNILKQMLTEFSETRIYSSLFVNTLRNNNIEAFNILLEDGRVCQDCDSICCTFTHIFKERNFRSDYIKYIIKFIKNPKFQDSNTIKFLIEKSVSNGYAEILESVLAKETKSIVNYGKLAGKAMYLGYSKISYMLIEKMDM